MALTLVQSYKVEATGNTATLTTASFTPSVGELLVIKFANSDGAQTINTPTVSGFTTGTVTSQVDIGTAGGGCRASLFTASVTSSAAGTVSLSISNSNSEDHAVVVERWSGAALAATPVVVSVNADTTSPWQQAVTTAQNGSVVSYVCADWNAGAPAGVSFSGDTTTPTQEQTATTNTGVYTVYWLTQAAATAGANTVGISAPAGANLTTAGIEVQDAGGGGTNATVTFTSPRTDITIH